MDLYFNVKINVPFSESQSSKKNFGCIWQIKSTAITLKNFLTASDSGRSYVFTFTWLVEDIEMLMEIALFEVAKIGQNLNFEIQYLKNQKS